MQISRPQLTLVDQVYEAILSRIETGAYGADARLIQEEIAEALGVSRQPVQQALLLLRNQGVLRDARGRGLIVAPLDPEHVEHMYDMRAAIEGLAARRAALACTDQAARQGAAIVDAGRKAVASGAVAKMIAADIRFHEFLYGLSGNSLIGSAMSTHLTYTQRVMGEVLNRDQTPRDIWDQHAQILEAIAARDADQAEQLARAHVSQAAGFVVARLRAAKDAEGAAAA